eukprot:scaffold24589_cov113-Isochrysis_galbana.AAC.8
MAQPHTSQLTAVEGQLTHSVVRQTEWAPADVSDDVEPARDEADQLFAQGTTSARIRHRIPRQLERVVEWHKE